MKTNSPIKKAYTDEIFTPQQIKELKKCANDPIYFIENYLSLVNEKAEEIPFKLFDFQKELIESLIENRYTIALWARQMGKCVGPDTVINVNGNDVVISDFINLSVRERINLWVEKKLLAVALKIKKLEFGK